MKRFMLALVVASLIMPALNVWAATPANDRFANRITLAGTNLTVTGSNIGASKETGEPDHAGNAGGKSVWWTWTAPEDGEATITTDGSSFDTVLGIYTGAKVSDLSVVATNDDHGVFVTSRGRFEVIRGTNYQIAVDGYNDGTGADSGSITLTLTFISEPIARPSNDSFADRILLSGSSVTTNGSNVEATREPGEPLHAEKLGDTSVWWSWTAPVAGTVTITTDGSSFDTLLAVYRGSSISNLTMVASNDDTDPATGILTSTVAFDTMAGTILQIAVDGFDGAAGQISLDIEIVSTWLSAPARLPDGTFQFVLIGAAGKTNEIDASEDLTAWTSVGTVVNLNGTVGFNDPTATNSNQRFYRALLKP